MIEINITASDSQARRQVELFEEATGTLADLITEELVKDARRLAPVNLRTRIQRKRMGQGWRVEARDEAVEPYIEQAVLKFNWRSALRRLYSKVR